jgi:micrococcal nuclease
VEAGRERSIAGAKVRKRCTDFPTQAEAQAFFEAAKPGDRHKLDFDDNDIACENRP